MLDNKKPLKIGIAGLGTVGAGVIKIFQNNNDILTARSGREIKIISVTASNKSKNRGVDLSAYDWAENLLEMASDNRLDVVVELIGGSDGLTKDFVTQALKNKKHVVTANKALLAHHGYELSQLAEENGVTIAYEAAVAGGVPVIKALREGLAGNKINSVYGILNGTCNYILTEMRKTKRNFDDVLKEAQEKGYAEADPSFDVDGIDAAHKLVLLGALAFGVQPDFQSLEIEGISNITIKDIEYAKELGYRIKLIGMARREGNNFVQIVAPCFVPKDSAVAHIEGVFNSVLINGDFVDNVMLEGRGAGEGPTASSVVSDIIDLAKENYAPTFGVKSSDLQKVKWQGAETLQSKFYIHLHVKDTSGVIADITSCLKDKDVSIDSFIQKGHEEDGTASVAIVTHKIDFIKVQKALDVLEGLPSVLSAPTLIRIEDI